MAFCAFLRKTPTVFKCVAAKNYSTQESIKKSVFISQSRDVFTNLALEDWILKNFDFSKHHLLLMWQNDSCVTIGKDRNPWLEANISNFPKIAKGGVKLARQTSDGDSMYHDAGTLNLTFFSPHERFDDVYNLNIISRAIFREYSLNVDANGNRLYLRGHQNQNISNGTAKVAGGNAYQRCTLCTSVNKIDFLHSLMSEDYGIQEQRNTNIKMMNLCEGNGKITVKDLLKVIGWEYMRTPAMTLSDGGDLLANQQMGFQLVNPTDNWFPGISNLRNTLTTWDWTYGLTPDFKIVRRFPLSHSGQFDDLVFEISISSGIVKNINFISNSTLNDVKDEISNIVSTSKNQKFSKEFIYNLEHSLRNFIEEDKDKFRETMTSF